MSKPRWLETNKFLDASPCKAFRISRVLALAIVIALLGSLVAGCAAAPTPTATSIPVPTAAPAVTATTVPTATPKPSPTTPPPPTAIPTPSFVDYEVEAGDNLHSIAEHFGVTGEAILKANPNVEDADKLMIGQKLKIPKNP
jgi:hypothetical protein